MGKTAFIFPGQGAQVCGMGQDFYENSETSKAVFDRATELLGFSVPELCFEKNDRLDITEYTQAAMVTTSVAMMKVMEERGIHADVAAGLSLGEYCALVAAGVMTADDAIRTVREPDTTPADELIKEVRKAMQSPGDRIQEFLEIFCKAFQLKYKRLTDEERTTLKRLFKRSPLIKNSGINFRRRPWK